MRTVLIVLFDRVQSLDVTGPLEVFAAARQGGGRAYRIRTASLGGAQVRTTSGLAISPDGDLSDPGQPPPDVLIVPGGEGARSRRPELVACSATTLGRPSGSPRSAPARSCWPRPGCSTAGG